MAAETLQYGISFRESVEPPSAHDTPPPGKNAAAISSGAETLPAPSQIDIGNTTVPHDAPSFPQPFSPSRISGHPSSLNSTRILKDARPLSIRPLGEARRKKHLNWLDIVSVAVAILCLVISIVAVSPQWPTIPWRLGLKVGLIRALSPCSLARLKSQSNWKEESYLINLWACPIDSTR